MFGIHLYGMHVEHLLPVVKHAEGLGFSNVIVDEHILEPENFVSVHPYDEGKDSHPDVTRARLMYDLWTMVGGVIGATSAIKVTTGIYILPLRHPVFSARAAVTAQQTSGGRFRLGVGVGWWKEESQNLGVELDRRVPRYEETLRVLRPLFNGEYVSSPGPDSPFESLRVTETPVEIPLIFGATKGKALDRAVRLGDGWYGPMITAEESIGIKNEIERRRADLGLTAPYTFETRVRGKATLADLAPYIDAGFDTLVLPNETIFEGKAFELTLDEKLRRLDELAVELKINA